MKKGLDSHSKAITLMYLERVKQELLTDLERTLGDIEKQNIKNDIGCIERAIKYLE